MANEVVLPPLPVSGFEVYETLNDPKFEVSESSSDKFVALNGTTKNIYFYDEMLENSYDEDYEGISSTGTVSFMDIDTSKFYKGKKVCLKKANDTGKALKWDDLKSCLLGFITEQTFSNDGVDIKLVGMSKLLDQEKKFSFKKTKRSKILKEMIESAGLKANINTTGLKDDEIDYTNVSSGSGSSELAGGQGKDIDELVAKWCEGKTSDLEKAKAIHAGLRDEVGIRYRKYYDTQYHTPENCLKHAQNPGLNCGDTSILTTACMLSGDLDAYLALRCDSQHYVTVITINGTKYYSDLTAAEGALSSRAWNEVWEGNKCFNKYGNGTRIE